MLQCIATCRFGAKRNGKLRHEPASFGLKICSRAFTATQLQRPSRIEMKSSSVPSGPRHSSLFFMFRVTFHDISWPSCGKGFSQFQYGDGSKPWYLVNPKIAGKWMFIPLKMYRYWPIPIWKSCWSPWSPWSHVASYHVRIKKHWRLTEDISWPNVTHPNLLKITMFNDFTG